MGIVGTNLEFWRHLAKEVLDNTIGMEPIYGGRTQRTCTIPEVLPCDVVMDPVFSGKWLVGLKKSTN